LRDSELAVGTPAVLALVRGENGQVAAEQAVPAGSKIGEPAPPLKLPDLKGKKVNLAAFRGTKTLVLFWNSGCGFCQQMLPDLKALEANPPEGAPKILVISTGTVEENKALGLRSRVVLDQQFSAGSAFGASGTPSAVLVDEEGKIASELAVGAPAVLALARGEAIA
jgi:peroxiredoxin